MREQRKRALLPKLRFPEFQDAGEWEVDELGTVAVFVNEKIPVEQVALENYVSTENILQDFGGVARASKLPIMGAVTRFRHLDTLVSNIRPYLKKVWVADKEGGASNDVIVIRAKQRLLPQYFSFLLKNDAFIDYVMTGAKGVKMPRGDIGSMKAYPACYPTKPEQQKIADCLTSVDELITAETQKLDTLKAYKKGLMQQLFPAEGETLPKLRFPEFQEAREWEPKQLIDILSPTIREVAKPSSTYLALGIRSHGKGTFHKPNQLPERNSMDRLYLVHRDDLIVNITFAWEGAIAIAGDEDHGSYVSHRFPTYSFKLSVSMPTFFRYVITNKAFVYKLGLISPGGAGRNRVMNKNDFLKISVLLPSHSEQQKIADCLTSIDELITAQTQKLAALKTHKKGLMQQLFPSVGGVDGEAGRGGRPVVDESQE